MNCILSNFTYFGIGPLIAEGYENRRIFQKINVKMSTRIYSLQAKVNPLRLLMELLYYSKAIYSKFSIVLAFC
jgi:hypothetical protein